MNIDKKHLKLIDLASKDPSRPALLNLHTDGLTLFKIIVD